MQVQAGVLNVTVKQANDLDKFFCPPDTYVQFIMKRIINIYIYRIVELGSQKCQTHKVIGNTDPVFQCKFTFQTLNLPLKTKLIITIKDDGFIRDTILGLAQISLGDLNDSNLIKMYLDQYSNKYNRKLKLKSIEGKTLNSTVTLIVEWVNAQSVEQPLFPQITAQEVKYAGVLQVKLLSADGVIHAKMANRSHFQFMLDWQTQSSGESTINVMGQQTHQFNKSMLFDLGLSKLRQMKIILLNVVFKDTIQVGEAIISIDQLGLYVNVPRVFEDEIICLGNKRCKISYEVQLLHNKFVANSIGSIQAELTNINFSTKSGIIFININDQTQYTSAPGTKVNSYNVKENIYTAIKILVYFNRSLFDFKGEGEIYKIQAKKPNITHVINLCEIKWQKQKNDDNEYKSIQEISLNNLKFYCQIKLKITFKNELQQNFYLFNQRQPQKSIIQKQLNPVPQKEVSTRSEKPIHRWALIKIRKITLQNISFKELKPPQLYVGLEQSPKSKLPALLSPLQSFTSICNDSSTCKWSCDIPLFLSTEQESTTVFNIFDLNLSVVKSPLNKLDIPVEFKELLKFPLNTSQFLKEVQDLTQLKEIAQGLHKHIIKKGVVGSKYVQFCKQAHNPAQWSSLKKIIEANPPNLVIEYTANLGAFIEWPFGMLQVVQVQGSGIQTSREYVGARVVLQLHVGLQQRTIEATGGTNQAPLFNVQNFFLTRGLFDKISVKLFYRLISDQMELLASADVPIGRLKFNNHNSCHLKLVLSQYSSLVSGNLVFQFVYQPIINNHNYKVSQLDYPQNQEFEYWGSRFKEILYQKQNEVSKITVFAKLQINDIFIRGLSQADVVQVSAEVGGQKYMSRQVMGNCFGMVGVDYEQSNLFTLDPLNNQLISITVMVLQISPDGQLFLKRAFDGHLDWSKYPLCSNRKIQVEINLKSSSLGLVIDFFDHNFVKLTLDLSSHLTMSIPSQLQSQPFQLNLRFNQFRCLNYLYNEKMNEKSLFFLRTTFPEEERDRSFKITFGRVGITTVKKNIVFEMNTVRWSPIVIPKLDQVVNYQENSDSFLEKFILFEKDLVLLIKHPMQIIRFEICQVLNYKLVGLQNDWNIKLMKNDSVPIFSRTLRAIELQWGVSDQQNDTNQGQLGSGTYNAIEFQRIKNNQIKQKEFFQNQNIVDYKETSSIGYSPIFDLQEEFVLICQVIEISFSSPPSPPTPPPTQSTVQTQQVIDQKSTLCQQSHLNILVEEITWCEDVGEFNQHLLGVALYLNPSEAKKQANNSTQQSQRLLDQWDYKYFNKGTYQFWEWDQTRLALNSIQIPMYERIYAPIKAQQYYQIYSQQLYIEAKEVQTDKLKTTVPFYQVNTLDCQFSTLQLQLKDNETAVLQIPLRTPDQILVAYIRASISQHSIRRLLNQSLLLVNIRQIRVVPLYSSDDRTEKLKLMKIGLKLITKDPSALKNEDYLFHCDSERYITTELESLQTAILIDNMRKDNKIALNALKSNVTINKSKQIIDKQWLIGDLLLQDQVFSLDLMTDVTAEIENLDALLQVSVYEDDCGQFSKTNFHLRAINFEYSDEIDPQKPTATATLESVVQFRGGKGEAIQFVLQISIDLLESDLISEQIDDKDNGINMNLAQLVKIKRIAEKMKKMLYIDRNFNPMYFTSQLKYLFTGYDQIFVSQQFIDMRKTVLGKKSLEQLLPQNLRKQFLHLQVPKETLLNLQGSMKLSFQLEFILIYKKEDKFIEIKKRVKSTQYQYEEERGDDDEVSQTKINLEKCIDFMVELQEIKKAKDVQIVLRYMNKLNEVIECKGIIEQQSLDPFFTTKQITISDIKDIKYVVVLLKPQNQRIFIQIRNAQSNFIENPVGICELTIHRIVRIQYSYLQECIKNEQQIKYKNKNILEKEKINHLLINKEVLYSYLYNLIQAHHILNENQQKSISNIFSRNSLIIQVACNSQKKYSRPINPTGIFEDSGFQTIPFFTSHVQDNLRFNLMLSIGSEQEQSIAMAPILKTNSTLKEDDLSWVLQPQQGVIIGDGELPLGNILVSPDSRAFFIAPINEVYYKPKDNALTEFYKIINTKDLYILGALSYNPIRWSTILLHFTELKGICVNKDWSGFLVSEDLDDGSTIHKIDYQEYIKIHLKAILGYSTVDGNFTEEGVWESRVFSNLLSEVIEQQIDLNLALSGNCTLANIIKADSEVDSIYCQVQLWIEFKQFQAMVGEKFLPLTKFYEQNKDLQQNLQISIPLLDLEDQSQSILQVNQQPKLSILIGISKEIPQKAEKQILLEEIAKRPIIEDEFKFDFRQKQYLDILCSTLNCGLPFIIIRGIQELNEFFLYNNPNQYENHIKYILSSLFSITKVYYRNIMISMVTLQAIYIIYCGCSKQTIEFIMEHKQQRILIEILHHQMINLSSINNEDFIYEILPSAQDTLDAWETPLDLETIIPEYFIENKANYNDIYLFLSKKYQTSINNMVGQDVNLNDKNQKDVIQNQGQIVLFTINLIAGYMRFNIDRTLQMAPYFPIIVEAYKIFDKFINNLANHFCHLVNNLIDLYEEIDLSNYLKQEDQEQEDSNVDLEIFPKLLQVLIENSKIASAIELNSILHTCNKLTVFFRRKDQNQRIEMHLDAFYEIMFGFLQSNLHVKQELSQHISMLIENLIAASENELLQNYIRNAIAKIKMQSVFIEIIRDELSRDINDSKYPQFLLKNTIEILSILIQDFGYAESQETICLYLKSRVQAVKKFKCATIINKFFELIETVKVLNEQSPVKEKKQKKEKQKKVVDVQTRLNQISTKYMISKLDWK